jgi:hypothetical protein
MTDTNEPAPTRPPLATGHGVRAVAAFADQHHTARN